jgi:hypothetical protein
LCRVVGFCLGVRRVMPLALILVVNLYAKGHNIMLCCLCETPPCERRHVSADDVKLKRDQVEV